MRRLFGLFALAWIVAMSLPALAAYREKRRRELAGEMPFDETADEIDLAVIFDSLEARSTASAFRGGDVLVWYGGGTLDLRDATLAPSGAQLNLRAIFGGLEVLVPPTWPVEVHPRAILGGVGQSRDAALIDSSSPTLVVDATAIMGGAAIVTRRDEADAGELVMA
jgi:predicted membrane protein